MHRALPRLFALLAAGCFLLSPALADSRLDSWKAACEWIIRRDTFLHMASYAGDGAAAAYTFRPVRAIAAGTPVQVLDTWEDMHRIAWQGAGHIAWVPADDVAPRTTASPTDPNLPDDASADPWEDFPMTLRQGDSEVPVHMVTLGTARSMVHDGTQVFPAATCDLSWETDAGPTKRLAMVTAPRTGRATLRSRPGSTAPALMLCPSGTLVIVLTPGGTYTQVLCGGQRGYLLTSALSFLAPAPLQDITSATLGCEDSAMISMYLSAGTARKVAEFPAGTQVLLFREGRTWSLVEADGMRGYVKTAYLR